MRKDLASTGPNGPDGSPDAEERLDLARDLMKEATPASWTDDTVSRVVDGVRRAFPSRPLRTYAADGSVATDTEGKPLTSTENALRTQVRQALAATRTELDSWSASIEGGRLAGLAIGLAGRYGDDLVDQGRRARALVAEVVRAALGPDPDFEAGRDLRTSIDDVDP